jgi:hypothetical protein
MAILSKVQRGQPITADLFNNMIDAIRECQVNSVVGSGGTIATFKRGPGGTTISINSQNKQGQVAVQPQICPFDITATVATSGTGYNVSFQAGTINGILPSNMLEPLTNVSTSSLQYFYLHCASDGKVITSAIIQKDTSLRTPQSATQDVAPSSFDILIGYMTTDGGTERVIACGNLFARISPSVQADSLTYVAGQRNYTQFYNWIY